jgi:hypothetical protein
MWNIEHRSNDAKYDFDVNMMIDVDTRCTLIAVIGNLQDQFITVITDSFIPGSGFLLQPLACTFSLRLACCIASIMPVLARPHDSRLCYPIEICYLDTAI